MKRAFKTFSSMVAVCAMVWSASPVRGACGFNIPMLQGGRATAPGGVLLNNQATHVNGFFWELGFGDPVDGAGNDCLSSFCGYPAFTRALVGEQWIKGAPGAPLVSYDWRSAGTDGCISDGAVAIQSTVYAHYIIDSNDDYAIAVLQGVFDGIPLVNLDLLVTGVGPNGNDVPMGPLEVAPLLTNATAVDCSCVEADIAPATAGMNLYFDAGGPYAGVVDVNGLSLSNAGSPEACDPNTGCHLSCIQREANLCWEGNALAVASQAPGDSTCVGGTLDGFPCGPVDDPNDFCATLGGVCPPVPPATTPFGPPIPGSCTFVPGCNVDDHAVARATKSHGFTIFQWEATQFGVSHYNLYDVTRGDRRINHDVIALRGKNDGSVTSYEFVATGADIRGGKRFELELVRTDGQKIRFTVE